MDSKTKFDTEEIISDLQMKDSARACIVQLLSKGPDGQDVNTFAYVERSHWRENGKSVLHEE